MTYPDHCTLPVELLEQISEQGLDFLSLSLCASELWCIHQLTGSLPGRLVLVDVQRAKSGTGALRSERTRATFLPCPDVVEGAIPIDSTAIVQ